MFQQFQPVDYLGDIQQFTLLCINSTHLPFVITNNQVTIGHFQLASYIRLFIPNQQLHADTLVYSFEVQLFYECRADLAFYFDGLQLDEVMVAQALRFNNLVIHIRNTYQRPLYKRLVDARMEHVENQKAMYKAYVSSLFSRYSKLMVLRIDLGYKPGTGSIENLQYHRDLFFQNRRSNSLFDYMVGYIWVMEYGQARGPHLHLLLFFDGQHVRNDSYYALEICAYWRRMVDELAWSHTSNIDKKQLMAEGRCGIGLIDHRDLDKVNNLNRIIDYLFKLDQDLPYRPSEHFRTMGRGNNPVLEGNVRGRPRTTCF